FVHWNDLKRFVAARFRPLSILWGFTSTTIGWNLRLKLHDQTILYMTPCKGHFLVSFFLSEKAVKVANVSGLPISTLIAIDNAKESVEGRGVRFEVKTAEHARNM